MTSFYKFRGPLILSRCAVCSNLSYRHKKFLTNTFINDVPVAKTKCRHCAALGNKNRPRSSPAKTEYVLKGRVVVHLPDGSWRSKHRLILEQKLNRLLQPYEQVGYLDGNRNNLDPQNLFLIDKTSPKLTPQAQATLDKLINVES